MVNSPESLIPVSNVSPLSTAAAPNKQLSSGYLTSGASTPIGVRKEADGHAANERMNALLKQTVWIGSLSGKTNRQRKDADGAYLGLLYAATTQNVSIQAMIKSPFSNRAAPFPLVCHRSRLRRRMSFVPPKSVPPGASDGTRRRQACREGNWGCVRLYCMEVLFSLRHLHVYQVFRPVFFWCHMHPAERGRTLQARRGSIHRLCRQGHKAGPLMAKGNTTTCSPARALTVECEIICTGFGVVSLLLPESEFTCRIRYSSLPGPTLLVARFRSSRSGVSVCGSTPSSSFSSEVTSGLACNQPKHKDSVGGM